ncbi:MAG: aminopeptidase [Thermoplasmatota archaeon]
MGKNGSELEEKLTFSPKNIWEEIEDEKIEEIFEFSDDYAEYITKSKTERLSIDESEKILKKNGFKSIDEYDSLEAGDKVYIINRNKSMAIAVIGEKDITEGCNLVASHVDAPRLDLKVNPLYEDKDATIALFKTHYYGGVKKYQWVNTPLAIHGRVIKEDGESVDISIGEDAEDLILVVSDLLPHLSRKKQGDRKMKDVIKGEELNIISASIPEDDDEAENKVKLKVLKLLNDKYGIKEEDFTSAELELVPAGPAKNVGLDESLLGAYGQDDRICAYTSMRAVIDLDEPEKTSIAVLFDKEEIGSEGNTGANSRFLDSVYSDLLSELKGKYTMDDHRKALENSKAMSGDVDPAVNPSFKEVHDLNNAARLGKGIVLTKFTGTGGKYSANDAHAEYVGLVRKIMNDNEIPWQVAELGKVDEGGGGTVAKFLANSNIEVIDAGPPILGMHSPFEITSKADIYYVYEAYKAFLKNA